MGIKKIVKYPFLMGMGIILGASMVYFKMKKKLLTEQRISQKNDLILQLYNQWLLFKLDNKSFSTFFRKNGYKNIAIYGMHYLGMSLYEELRNTDINVKYAIDRNKEIKIDDLRICTPDEELMKVDVIIVTAVYYFNEIEEVLSEKVECPILSLEDIMLEL